MIESVSDLKYYLAEDLKRFDNHRPGVKDRILHNEVIYLFHYIRHLRYIEYYQNTRSNRLMLLYHWWRFKRLGFKLRVAIYPNTVGPGFRLYHAGDYVHVGANVVIGSHCTLLPGVVFGNKGIEESDASVTVGDHCYFGLGARIVGAVKIGNHVTVGANAVVTEDIADNAVVAGIPARVIRYK